ncbi:WW domain [Trypanosoma vivax]|nr:WW domain [Trypanosoma vivax]
MNEEEHVVVPSVGEAFVGEDGTVSVVLSYDIDDAYEPTQDEIAEYAEWMGMKLPEDNEFLYIAREGLKAPLPQYWRPCRTNDDEIYYFNFKTGESTWSHPMDDYYREKFRKVKAEKENLGGGGAAQDNKIAVGLPFAMGKDEGSTLAKASALGKTAGHSAVLSDGARSPGVLSQVLPQPVSAVHGGPRPLDISNRSTSSLSEIGNSNKQIVSEAEKNLEEKIRRECEAVIVEEQKKAESALLERRQNMYRTHEAEMKKLRADHEAKLAALRSSAPLETEEALRERREATEKLTASLSQAKKEMEDLEKQLAQLKEEDVRSLASEVAKAEAAVGAEMEQLVKAVKADSMLLLEKMKGELRAEFELNMAELQKKAQEEARELNEAIEKAHAEEVAAIRQRVLDENTKSQVGGAVGDSLCSEGDEEAKIATIRAKEEEEVAAIRKRSAEEQAELRASMQAKIDELHEELCDLEGRLSSPSTTPR